MGRAPSLCGVILAAGESSRMGREKALLPWPPSTSPAGTPSNATFLSANISALSGLSDLVIVVAGNNEALVAPQVYAAGGFLVRNAAPEQGQFSSLQTGLRDVLNRGRDAAIITLVDRPPVRDATLQRLQAGFESAYAQRKWAVVPEYSGKHGHPIIVGREMIEAFLKAPVASTAREVEQRHAQHIAYVPVDDPFVTINVNTPTDYASLSAMPRST